MKSILSIAVVGIAIFGLVEIALIGASYLLISATNITTSSEVVDASVRW